MIYQSKGGGGGGVEPPLGINSFEFYGTKAPFPPDLTERELKDTNGKRMVNENFS